MASKKMELQDLNSLITCKICKGYFVDATTVTECLHTFCRSCIVKHFKRSLFCPECEVQVERGCPLNKLRPDPRKQLLVYKMVPRLHVNEMTRQQNFLKKFGTVIPLHHANHPIAQRPLLPSNLSEEETVRDRIVDKIHLYAPEDKISLSVEYESGVPAAMNGDFQMEKQVNCHKRYLQCPAALTVYHLKKFIRLKYEIGSKHLITVCYEGEPIPDDSSLMDIAYQFFYEAKSPMRFTYRISPGDSTRTAANANSRTTPVPADPPVPQQPPQPPQPPQPTVTVKPLGLQPVPRHSSRGSSSSTTSSSDEGSTSTRRQQRQRSAKTAAYSAIEAMDESDRDEEDPPMKRRRLAGKSPRWESPRGDSPEPYTVYRNTRRTPKTSLEDFEARYNINTGGKRVYAICSDDELSDPETKRNTLANRNSSARYGNILSLLKTDKEPSGRSKSMSNGKKSRSKKADEDVYEFNAHNEDNEDSNTTQEYDFVYDNSDHESAESEKVKREYELNDGANGSGSGEDRDLNEIEADELEKQIEMEVVTDTDDIDQHIEDSIEEVEVDADDDGQGQEEADEREALAAAAAEENEHQLEAETNSSSCLVIAEDDEDDGVVEEVIAAEEDGHELVVVEDPEETDVTYTVEVFNVAEGKGKMSDKASHSSRGSTSSHSPTVEEDEPEIVHEKVFRKKSKKSKHHHHHHHHKRKRHHSPVMVISSPEEAPMKLTLKLRPTPSISPGHSSKSPGHESPTKEKRSYVLSPRRESTGGESPKSPSQKIFTVKITPPRMPTPTGASENTDGSKGSNAKTESVASKQQEPSESPTPGNASPSSVDKSSQDVDKTAVPDDAKERLTQMRQVRIKSVTSTPTSPPPSPSSTSPKPSPCVPDLKSVKTPSSLTISKVEAGGALPRGEEPSNKPALEILVLPPSPPPSDKQSDDSEECSTTSEPPAKKKKEPAPVAVKKPPVKDSRQSAILGDTRQNSLDQVCVLDLSGRRDSLPRPPPARPAISPISASMPPKPPPPPMQFILHPPGSQPDSSLDSAQLRNYHNNIIDEATIATVNRMNSMLANGHPLLPGLPLLPFNSNQALNVVNNAVAQQRRLLPTPSLNSMLGGRAGRSFLASGAAGTLAGAMPGAMAGTSRPNQSVRHIPNPSALLHRQQNNLGQTDKDKKQQGQLTEQQLKERYQQFQQNRAAKAAFTYSRASGSGSAPVRSEARSEVRVGAAHSSSGAQPSTSSMPAISAGPSAINNNNVAKSAFRPRSIEKVAGLLSVRAGAFAVEAQAGL